MKNTKQSYQLEEGIEYIIQKGNVKNIYIKIKDGTVIIRAPYLVSNQYIRQMVEKKKEWITKNLEKSKKMPEQEITKEKLEILQKNIIKILKEYQEKTGLYPKKCRIRSIQYAWGSCSSKGNITISTKLANQSEKELSYVILHELCHLKHMNHSKDFWNLVGKYMPNYKEIRKKLKGGE